MVASGIVSVDGAIELRKTRKVRVGEVVMVGAAEIVVRSPPSADPC
jgi:ribosome-associated protein